MKSHWKSSESPLYVRIIWKQGARHAILQDEDIEKKRYTTSFNPKKEEKSTSSAENNLETCLTKLKLDSKEKNIPQRAVSCEPTFICDPICKVITKPSYVKHSYYYVNNLHGPSPTITGTATENCTRDAFTERILQWLNSTSGSINFVPSLEEVKVTKKVVKERPKTSPGTGSIKANLGEDLNTIAKHEDECSFIQCERSRPQLHIFVPIFDNDHLKCIKKSKSMDDVL